MAAVILATVVLPATATAAQGPEFTLTASPAAVSWPDSPEFRYRLSVKAGPEALDVNLKFPDPGWGSERTAGSAFTTAAARLEGFGELIPGPMPPILPLRPGTCTRGGPPWASVGYYRLTLGAGQETTVVADSRLAAAPLPTMPREIAATVWTDGGSPVELTAPLAIGGRFAPLVESRFVGAGDALRIDRRAGRAFRLMGTTEPPLPRRLLRIEASSGAGGPPGVPRLLGTVRTDDRGGFRSGPLRLRSAGTWMLKTSLADPGRFDNTPGCAGTVRILPTKRPSTLAELEGHSFISTRVAGKDLGEAKVHLKFFWHQSVPGRPVRPTLLASAGCNLMAAPYHARNGRLRWAGPPVSTQMYCQVNHDPWLASLLRRGVKANLAGKRLVLIRGRTRIVLRQTPDRTRRPQGSG